MQRSLRKLSTCRPDFVTAAEAMWTEESQAENPKENEDPETANGYQTKPTVITEILKPLAANQQQRIPKVTSLGKRQHKTLDSYSRSSPFKRLKDSLTEHINR